MHERTVQLASDLMAIPFVPVSPLVPVMVLLAQRHVTSARPMWPCSLDMHFIWRLKTEFIQLHHRWFNVMNLALKHGYTVLGKDCPLAVMLSFSCPSVLDNPLIYPFLSDDDVPTSFFVGFDAPDSGEADALPVPRTVY